MVNVVVRGLPKGVKLPKFVTFLKRVVFRCRKELHINYVRLLVGNSKQISVSTSYKEALKAKRILNGFVYNYAKEHYTLECWLENLDEDKIDFEPGFNIPVIRDDDDRYEHRAVEAERMDRMDYEPPAKSRRFSNSPVRLRSLPRSKSRSRSPHGSSELRAIELKIELIRKQRILMEEETKLLLEKRKLQFLQNFGSKDSGKLAKFEEVCRRNNATEISNFLASAEPSRAVNPPKLSKLPGFIGPIKEISSQMKALVRSHSEINPDNVPLLWNLLRASVKKRLAIILEGKSYMPTKAVVGLYRVKHPQITDKSLVDELLKTIKTSFWPEKPKKAESKEAENPPADAQEVDLTETEEHENQVSEDTSQFVELDQYVDLENDVENWTDDENEANPAKSFDNGESNAAADDVTEPNTAEENDVFAETNLTTFEEVDEAVLIVDDADKFRESENAEGAGVEQTAEDYEEL